MYSEIAASYLYNKNAHLFMSMCLLAQVDNPFFPSYMRAQLDLIIDYKALRSFLYFYNYRFSPRQPIIYTYNILHINSNCTHCYLCH